MKTYEDIIIEPILSEKADLEREKGVYAFKVDKKANKPEIKKAIEKIFKVKVKKVNIVNIKGKRKRVNFRYYTNTSGYKKAYVTLEKGQTISLFEGL